jgi:ubiquinone biosynthesis protein COQ4
MTVPAASQHSVQPRQWRAAFRALKELRKNNDDTTQVFKIIDALRGDSDHRNTERMRLSETGQRILTERLSLIEVLSKREELRTLPAGSLGRVYLDFMEKEGLSADGLAAASVVGSQYERGNTDVETFSNWARDSHDLWHVLSGYGRDPLGELCLLGVLYSQVRNMGTGFMALLTLPTVAKAYPGAPSFRAVLQGFVTGYRANWLVDQDWQALLPLPLEQVRADLKIAKPSYYQRSLRLFDAAASNSEAMVAQVAGA